MKSTIMKSYGVAVLSLSLLSGLAVQTAYADEFLPPGPILKPVPVKSLQPQNVPLERIVDVAAILQVFHEYVYYHDTHNGELLASLFTSNGIFEDLYNDSANGTLDPTKGVGGLGCLMTGRAQIAQYINVSGGGGAPLAFPGHSHHMPTAEVVVFDPLGYGDTATLTANFQVVSTSATGVVSAGLTADYIIDFQRDWIAGWQIVRNLPINDEPGVSSSCSLNGPIPPVP
jgi:hypothetical protein